MINPLRILIAGFSMISIAIGLAFLHPFGNPRSGIGPAADVLAGADIPDALRQLMRHKCGNCHSEAVDWPFYSHVAPLSWMMERDVTRARERMNLSRWQLYTRDEKSGLLTRLGAKVRSGEMPPGRYTAIHRDSKLSSQEQQLLYEWARAERKRLRTVQLTFGGE